VPGAALGTSDLLVDLAPGQLVTGSVEADNAGNRYTGAARIGATINLNNMAGRGDVASLRVLYSGSGLAYGRASYQMQFGRLMAGVAYTALNYQLGEEFSSLQAHGTARIASLYGSYPLIRSRNSNLNLRLDYDHKSLRDFTDSTSTVTDKRAQVLTLGLNGNGRDRLGGGGAFYYSIALSSGDLDIRTPVALAADAATARSNGRFLKLALQGSRLQHLTDRLSLYVAMNGQLASKNLDISEKMALGGPYGVRAYPVGEAYGDEAYVLNLEARFLLPPFAQAMPGQMHLIGFVDTGAAVINRNPWAAGSNHRQLSGAGIGLTWEDFNNLSLKLAYARKLGHEVATSAPDRSGRFWIQLVKYF
jgi:hemolysin activation/secretion protein